MKRLLSLLFFLLTASAAFAGHRIPASEALGKASSFFDGAAMSGKMKTASVSRPLKLVETAPDDAFYIFNRDGGGFVIVSGDDSVGPYLGFSYNNSFSVKDMPDNVRRFLESLEEEVKYYRAHPDTKAGGSSVMAPLSSDEKVLATAQWNQSAPYNDLCPVYKGESCPVGCVPLGMAIVLRYKKWPERGTGHLDSYETETHKIQVEGYDLGHAYDWDSMPLESLSKSAQTDAYQVQQIATIVHDCAVMLQVDFAPGGTGSHSEKVLPELIEHLGYDADNILEHRYKYSAEEWMSMIKKSIDNDCPVLFAGNSDDGGHEFVVDGYRGDEYVDINFGWGGYCNGFYHLSQMGDYQRNQVALFNLQKDKGGKSREETLIVVEGVGLSVDGTWKEGSGFTVNVSCISNHGTGEFAGEFAIGLNDKEGELQEIISDIASVKGTGYVPNTCFVDFKFTCNDTRIKPGRGVQLYIREKANAAWTKAYYDELEGTKGIIYPAGETADPLDEMTFEYDKSTGIITIKFPPGVEADCSFSAAGCWHFGDDWDTGGKSKSMSISTAGLAAGNYKINYTVNGQNFTIELPIGNSK